MVDDEFASGQRRVVAHEQLAASRVSHCSTLVDAQHVTLQKGALKHHAMTRF